MATAPHVGLMQRRASGPAARQVGSRSAQSRWLRDRETPTALEHLPAQEAIRVPELLPLRYERMAASAWTYFRGAAAAKAADLATRTHSGILMQMAGDAHVLNFGLWGIRHVLVDFARACGEAFAAKAHARSGDPAAIAGYLGRNDNFTRAMCSFARSYADRHDAGHADLVLAVARAERDDRV